jgi:hypothetical protein
LAVVKAVMSIRVIKEDNLDRPNITEWLVACMCHAVRLSEIYFAGFTCGLQNFNNYTGLFTSPLNVLKIRNKYTTQRIMVILRPIERETFQVF